MCYVSGHSARATRREGETYQTRRRPLTWGNGWCSAGDGGVWVTATSSRNFSPVSSCARGGRAPTPVRRTHTSSGQGRAASLGADGVAARRAHTHISHASASSLPARACFCTDTCSRLKRVPRRCPARAMAHAAAFVHRPLSACMSLHDSSCSFHLQAQLLPLDLGFVDYSRTLIAKSTARRQRAYMA